MIFKELQTFEEDCKLLASDVQAMINAANNDKKASRKSLESTTILRKDTEELIDAEKEDPDMQFIIDQFSEILGAFAG